MTNELVINYNNSRFVPAELSYVPADNITYEQWVRDGELLRDLKDFTNFAIGDWLIAGEHKFGEMYAQAIDEFKFGNYSKLSKLVWVARNVPFNVRHANLTWTHHHHVASLPEQEQAHWLGEADLNEWTAAELKEQIKESRMIIDTTNAVMAKGASNAPGIAHDGTRIADDVFYADEPPFANDALYSDDVPSADDFWHTNGYQQSTKLYVHCPGCDELTQMPAGAIVAAGVSEWQCAMCETRWAITTTFERVS